MHYKTNFYEIELLFLLFLSFLFFPPQPISYLDSSGHRIYYFFLITKCQADDDVNNFSLKVHRI